ncbi:MAG: penicillin-binding transpeptidase domain-containing protein [Saccharofermentanales bacterium]
MNRKNGRNLEADRRFLREKQRQQRRRAKRTSADRSKQVVRQVQVKGPRSNVSRPGRSRRLGFAALFILVILFAGLLIYRLYNIQIVEHATFAETAAGQHYKKVAENPKRGRILDRNGLELAGTTYVYRIGVTPKDVYSITKNISRQEIADNIAACLNMESHDILVELEKTDSTYIQLKKDVPRAEAEALLTYKRNADIGGIRIDAEPQRYYTNGSLASQVIGYTNYDNGNLVGQLGVELQYNTLLTGEPGYTYVETDNYLGRGELPFSVPTSLRAKDGQNIILHLDVNIQKIAQEILAKAVKLYDVTHGGSIVVMNPHTGAVLAMASYPYFSSAEPAARPDFVSVDEWESMEDNKIDFLSSEVWRNKAISNTYEPGSTMKAITASIALEEALTSESEIMNDAPLYVLDWKIECWYKRSHGLESLQQAFWNSCNPVFAQLAQRVGVTKFYDYIRAYGLSAPTGIDLPAESAGILHAKPTELDMVTLSYGESSTATPLQIATAYCALANGGRLVRPMLAKAVTDHNGSIVKEFQPETIRKAISETTSTRIMELLKGVVLYGTGTPAYVEGYAVAGKTSTSTDEQGYHTLSFAGIAPADSPEIVVLVVLEKPSDKDVSSRIASTACGETISRTLEYMAVPRVYSDRDVSRLTQLHDVPEVVGMTYGAAVKQLTSLGFRVEAGDSAMGNNTKVRYQWPAADAQLHKSGLIILYPESEPEEKMVVIPDFTGKNVNECMSSAAESGLNILINGDSLGIAAGQDPAPTYSRQPIIKNELHVDPEEPIGPLRLKRGSTVTIRFETFEEIVAQPDAAN